MDSDSGGHVATQKANLNKSLIPNLSDLTKPKQSTLDKHHDDPSKLKSKDIRSSISKNTAKNFKKDIEKRDLASAINLANVTTVCQAIINNYRIPIIQSTATANLSELHSGNTSNESNNTILPAEKMDTATNYVTKSSTEQKNERNHNRYIKGKSFPPFTVFIERAAPDRTPLYPLFVGKNIHNNNVNGVNLIKKQGRCRISVEFDSADNANKFVEQNPKFINLDTYIPRHLVYCQGVIILNQEYDD